MLSLFSRCLCRVLVLAVLVTAVPVAASAQVISMQAIEQAGRETIVASVGQDAGYEIMTAYLPRNDVNMPDGEVVLQGELPYGLQLRGPTVVNVRIAIDGVYRNAVRLRFNVRKYGNVLVAAKMLAANEPLNKACVRLERQDLGKVPPGFMTAPAEVEGMTVHRPIREGTVLTKYIVVKPVIVKRGAILNLIARSGNMEVSAMGQALDDGVEGQTIRVRNLSSQKTVTAKIIDAGSALVAGYMK